MRVTSEQFGLMLNVVRTRLNQAGALMRLTWEATLLVRAERRGQSILWRLLGYTNRYVHRCRCAHAVALENWRLTSITALKARNALEGCQQHPAGLLTLARHTRKENDANYWSDKTRADARVWQNGRQA